MQDLLGGVLGREAASVSYPHASSDGGRGGRKVDRRLRRWSDGGVAFFWRKTLGQFGGVFLIFEKGIFGEFLCFLCILWLFGG